MKYLVTMNMPSARDYLVHQLTVEHPAETCAEFCKSLNQYEFILCRLLYRQRGIRGETVWIDRGDLVINTAHVGKVQEFIEVEKGEYRDDESYGSAGNVREHSEGSRGPIRPRRGMF